MVTFKAPLPSLGEGFGVREKLGRIYFANRIAQSSSLGFTPFHPIFRVKVSYPLTISEQLRGELDYFLQLDSQLLVIEAKNADLQKGFTQLGVELLAIAQSGLTDSPVLYGAVTVGNIWQFGVLHRQEKRIVQDLNLFRVPADLDDLMATLIAIVKGE
jgi:hypothetical protein